MPKMLRFTEQDLLARAHVSVRIKVPVKPATGRTQGVSGASSGSEQAAETGSRNAVAAQGAWLMLPYPVSCNRVWRNYGGRMVPSPKAETWKRVAAILVREAGIGFYESGVEVCYKLHPRVNKDGSASKVKLDLDAPLKVLLDAFNGVVWHDDKQVLRLAGEYGDAIDGGGLSVLVVAS